MIVSKLTFPWAKNYNDRFGNQYMHPVSYISAANTYHSLELERKQRRLVEHPCIYPISPLLSTSLTYVLFWKFVSQHLQYICILSTYQFHRSCSNVHQNDRFYGFRNHVDSLRIQPRHDKMMIRYGIGRIWMMTYNDTIAFQTCAMEFPNGIFGVCKVHWQIK